MPLVDSAELPSNERLPGWNGRFFHSERKFAITIDGVEHIASPGCAAIVPPNTPHSARALGACRAIVVDYPIRDEVGGVRTDD